MKEAEFANRGDSDEAARNELPQLDLHCLPSSLLILIMVFRALEKREYLVIIRDNFD